MIKFIFPVGGANIELESDSPQKLGAMFRKLGGDEEKLIAEIRKAAANPFQSVLLAASTSRVQAAGTANENATAQTADEPADPWDSSASSTQTARPSSDPDPWADDGAVVTNDNDDNWPAQGAGRPSSKTDDFGRVWTFDLPEAPNCQCGIKAVRMKAKAKQSGKPYTKWRCAKSAGKNWQDKCEYDEFTN